jgi:hypothetical protein
MEIFEMAWQESQGAANRLNRRKEGDMPMLDGERIKVARNMVNYGGGFISRLGEALFHADPDNTAKIKQAWPDEWDRYKQMTLEVQDGTGE